MKALKTYLMITSLTVAATTFAGAEANRKGTLAPGAKSNARISTGAFLNGLSRWDQLGKTPLRRQMEKIGLKKVKLDRVPLDVALKGIRQDIAESGGPKINFFIKAPTAQRKKAITMELENMPLIDVIRFMCMRANLVYKIEEHAVVLTPAPPGTKY